MNKIILFTTIWLLIPAMVCPAAGEKLRITLNENVVLDENRVCLGRISILTGPEELVKKANAVVLGTFCSKGQVLYADRNTILSRLASEGISTRQIELAGPERTQIRRNEKCVEPRRIIETARACIDQQLKGLNVCSVEQIGSPLSVILDDPNAPVQLSAQMSRYQTPGAKKVTVTLTQNGTTLSQQEITFSVRFRTQRAVALRDLMPGKIIQKDDFKTEQVESSDSEPGEWKEPAGMAVRRRISKGSQIHLDWLADAEGPVMIKRNQQVVVQLKTESMLISAAGQALDEGRAGDLIRVKRGQRPDERVIYCLIQPDGTVSPKI